MVEYLGVSPQFLSSMLGEPEYWAPGDFFLHDQHGSNKSLGKPTVPLVCFNLLTMRLTEFFCQHPRWQMHAKNTPFSVYMKHDFGEGTTSYIVMADRSHPRAQCIKRRISTCFSTASTADTQDPFMIHCLIVEETLVDAKSVVTPLRLELYNQLDQVDECIPSHDRGKADLELMTVKLHYISRMIDPLIANADMTGMIMRHMQASHDRYSDSLPVPGISNATTKTSDSIRYLLESAESQKRWLVSYKSRKDATMNLVSLLYE